MTAFNLDDGIVFVILPLPSLRLLVLIGNKNVGDVNGLKNEKIMIGWQGGKMLITSAERSRVRGAFLARFFLPFLFLKVGISLSLLSSLPNV